ncbi:MAG: hypothetical protein IJF09_01100 [Ruminiclostridium sp.]|nr:hypothetical protein [Ruminiclostridium sp.]
MKTKLLNALTFVLCIAMFSICSVGCGMSGNLSINSENSEIVTNSSDDSLASIDSSLENEITDVLDSSDTNTSEAPVITSKDVVVENTVLVNKDGVLITATGIEQGLLGTELKLSIENNTNINLVFNIRDVSVNGFMIRAPFSEIINAGEKLNTCLNFEKESLKECNIDIFAYMEFSFEVSKVEVGEVYLDTEIFKLETTVSSIYTQKIDDSGDVLYDDSGIKIVKKGLASGDSTFGPGVILYVENNSTKNYTLQGCTAIVNGYGMSTILSQEITAGNKVITKLMFLKSSLDENNITDIHSIETQFYISETDDYMNSIYTDMIKMDFNS